MSRTGKRILVAVDGSEISKEAFVFSLKFIQNEDDLAVIHVRSLEDDMKWSYDSALPNEAIFSKSSASLRAQSLCDEYLSLGKKFRVNVRMLAAYGDPRIAICDAIVNERVSLVVVGSRGRGVLKRLLLGSVSNHVVCHSSCPVLVVRPQLSSKR